MLPVGDIELSDEILEKVIYGPEKFVCNADAPTVLEVVISSVDFNGHQAPYSLIVVNGEVDGGFRVTNARILVNNVEIFNQSDFVMKVEPLERGIELNASSNLRVELLDESGNCRSCEVTNNSNEPFAYYPFNENANDESINVNDGVVNGASLTSDRFGNANSAYHFDGIDDFMNCGSNSSLKVSDAISISLWVKPEENSSIPQLLTKEEEYKLSLYPENKISFALSNANPG